MSLDSLHPFVPACGPAFPCGRERPCSHPPLDGHPVPCAPPEANGRSFARLLAARPQGAAGPSGPAPIGPAGRGPGRPPRLKDDEGLLTLVRRFALLYLEVEAGRRELRQLTGLVTPRLGMHLAAMGPGGGPSGRLHHVAGLRSRPDCFDAVAVVRRGSRFGAIAVRVVSRRGRWLVDQACRPEDAPYSVRSAVGPMAPGGRGR